MYLIAGDHTRSVELLNGIIADDPAHVEARYRLGELANAAGDRKTALVQWERNARLGVVRPHSRDEELLGLAALAVADDHAGKGDQAKAEQLYEEAAARLPNDPRPLLAWSGMLARSGGDKKAIELLQQALLRGADEVLVRNNLGSLMLRDGSWIEARSNTSDWWNCIRPMHRYAIRWVWPKRAPVIHWPHRKAWSKPVAWTQHTHVPNRLWTFWWSNEQKPDLDHDPQVDTTTPVVPDPGISATDSGRRPVESAARGRCVGRSLGPRSESGAERAKDLYLIVLDMPWYDR
ncbi:MAG: tetratricopeptide repeat protein [Flavobacteriales bacterium]|nr:tetratricopeptide repeat protein [Flavobacteriales bacterium]